MDEHGRHDISALLRAARATYGKAIRTALAEAGFDDIPGNGLFVVGAVARTRLPMASLVRALGVTKQAAGKLVDTLALRGYVERVADPDDRRRLLVAPTPRGAAAAEAIRAATGGIDAQLAARVPAAQIAHARAVLLALAALGDDSTEDSL
ncbi:MarR family winged helix-turn-helix transcriptional regulator [Thermomonas brevis]